MLAEDVEALDTYVGSVDQRQAIWSQLPHDRDVAAVRANCPSAGADDDPRFLAIVAHLNYFENLAVGVEHDVYDTSVIDSLVGERLVAAWVAYEPFIVDRRTLLGSSRVWCSFEALATREWSCCTTLCLRRRPGLPPAGLNWNVMAIVHMESETRGRMVALGPLHVGWAT